MHLRLSSPRQQLQGVAVERMQVASLGTVCAHQLLHLQEINNRTVRKEFSSARTNQATKGLHHPLTNLRQEIHPVEYFGSFEASSDCVSLLVRLISGGFFRFWFSLRRPLTGRRIHRTALTSSVDRQHDHFTFHSFQVFL